MQRFRLTIFFDRRKEGDRKGFGANNWLLLFKFSTHKFIVWSSWYTKIAKSVLSTGSHLLALLHLYNIFCIFSIFSFIMVVWCLNPSFPSSLPPIPTIKKIHDFDPKRCRFICNKCVLIVTIALYLV